MKATYFCAMKSAKEFSMLDVIEHWGALIALVASCSSVLLAMKDVRELAAKTGSNSLFIGLIGGTIFRRK